MDSDMKEDGRWKVVEGPSERLPLPPSFLTLPKTENPQEILARLKSTRESLSCAPRHLPSLLRVNGVCDDLISFVPWGGPNQERPGVPIVPFPVPVTQCSSSSIQAINRTPFLGTHTLITLLPPPRCDTEEREYNRQTQSPQSRSARMPQGTSSHPCVRGHPKEKITRLGLHPGAYPGFHHGGGEHGEHGHYLSDEGRGWPHGGGTCPRAPPSGYALDREDQDAPDGAQLALLN
ncbi:unnamed protein product [Cyprideis torosa]|uniref:Uncharacterized protein n=1 Tax=Cyprideis torosa TaxID=163714 RepID=A0A7R8ZV46_9CRUS|nr:unnamed protein product [Cyprideis torosa]CAG0901808.1 unnamed protein product [Cyprideis torosa]